MMVYSEGESAVLRKKRSEKVRKKRKRLEKQNQHENPQRLRD